MILTSSLGVSGECLASSKKIRYEEKFYMCVHTDAHTCLCIYKSLVGSLQSGKG